MTVRAPVPVPRKVFEDLAPSICPHVELRRHQQGLRAGQYVDARLEMAWLFWQGLASELAAQTARADAAVGDANEAEQRLRYALPLAYESGFADALNNPNDDQRRDQCVQALTAECMECRGTGEIYSGHMSYEGHLQPPEPIMDRCPECGGDGHV